METARLQLTGLETLPPIAALGHGPWLPSLGAGPHARYWGLRGPLSGPRVPRSQPKPSSSSCSPLPCQPTPDGPPPSAGLSSPTGSPMRNLIQTQFGTCLHIDCVVIKWLQLRRGCATCISKLPRLGLGPAAALASNRGNRNPGRPASGRRKGVRRLCLTQYLDFAER